MSLEMWIAIGLALFSGVAGSVYMNNKKKR